MFQDSVDVSSNNHVANKQSITTTTQSSSSSSSAPANSSSTSVNGSASNNLTTSYPHAKTITLQKVIHAEHIELKLYRMLWFGRVVGGWIKRFKANLGVLSEWHFETPTFQILLFIIFG